jgi:hypothetical protein
MLFCCYVDGLSQVAYAVNEIFFVQFGAIQFKLYLKPPQPLYSINAVH